MVDVVFGNPNIQKYHFCFLCKKGVLGKEIDLILLTFHFRSLKNH